MDVVNQSAQLVGSELVKNYRCSLVQQSARCLVAERDKRPEKICIGMTENTFKTRFNGHKVSLKHKSHRNDTTLSKYIWELKDNGTNFNIHWSIVKRAKAYKGSTRRCNLCLTEKLCILSAPKDTLLNKRSELVSKCRHENKFCATNQKKPP